VAKRASVILVNYNGMEHLDVCIPSVLKQSHPDFEVIFVDNGSDDGSLQYAREKFPGLKFIANDENLGYAGGINSGLAHATGDCIAPLNVDTEVAPNWLGSMVDFLEANPRAGAVTAKVLLFDRRDTINARGLNIHVTGLAFCRELHHKDDGASDPVRVPGISGCSYMISRQLLEAMGGAPDWCFLEYDDVIVSWLLQLMDRDVYCLPQATVFHKYSLKMFPQKFFRLEKNRHILLLSTLKPLTLLACLPVLLVVELMMLVYSLLRGRAYVKAGLAVPAALWRERHSIRQRREKYRKLRKISDWRLLRRLNWNLSWRQLLQITR